MFSDLDGEVLCVRLCVRLYLRGLLLDTHHVPKDPSRLLVQIDHVAQRLVLLRHLVQLQVGWHLVVEPTQLEVPWNLGGGGLCVHFCVRLVVRLCATLCRCGLAQHTGFVYRDYDARLLVVQLRHLMLLLAERQVVESVVLEVLKELGSCVHDNGLFVHGNLPVRVLRLDAYGHYDRRE